MAGHRMSYWDQYDFIGDNPLCTKAAPMPDNKTDNDCHMRDLLSDAWFAKLSPIIKTRFDGK